MSLGDLQTVENIAGMLRGYHEPQILESSMPEGAEARLPTTAQLIADNTRTLEKSSPPQNPNAHPGELTFQARCPGKRNATFKLFAKSSKWHEDFWSQLVAHRLGVNLDVVTWRRVTKTNPIASQDGGGATVYDGYAVWNQTLGWYFPETLDHAKFVVAMPEDSGCRRGRRRQPPGFHGEARRRCRRLQRHRAGESPASDGVPAHERADGGEGGGG
jgi:hypothetical protein